MIPTPESEAPVAKPSLITQKTGLVVPSNRQPNDVNRWVQELMGQWEKLHEPIPTKEMPS